MQRYARAATWQEMVHGRSNGPRASILDAFTAYLQQRMDDGCGNILQLFREIQTLGYTGSYSTLRDDLRDRRPIRPPLPPPAPSAREVTNGLTRRPYTLTDSEQIHVTDLSARCPELHAAHGCVRTFAIMLTQLTGTIFHNGSMTFRPPNSPACRRSPTAYATVVGVR